MHLSGLVFLLLLGRVVSFGRGGTPSASGASPVSHTVASGTYTLTVTGTANNYKATQSLTLVVQ